MYLAIARSASEETEMLFSDDEVNNPDKYIYPVPDGMEINAYLPALEEITQRLIQLVDVKDEDKRLTPLLSIVNLSIGDGLGTKTACSKSFFSSPASV